MKMEKEEVISKEKVTELKEKEKELELLKKENVEKEIAKEKEKKENLLKSSKEPVKKEDIGVVTPPEQPKPAEGESFETVCSECGEKIEGKPESCPNCNEKFEY